MTMHMLKPRKRHVQVEQDAILAWLREQDGARTLREIAEHFDIHTATARRLADGLAAQGKLTVEPGSKFERDHGPIPRRYTAVTDAWQGGGN
jgi:DNA-binding MarR family transcriptional regulator